MSVFQERLALFRRALDRLDEALAAGPVAGDLLSDAAIQRFEFTIEIGCRALQAALAAEGIEARSPRACVKGGYAQHWLDGEAVWLAMLEDRNRTSHTYRPEIAAEVLARLPGYRDAMRAAERVLANLPH